MKTHGVAAVAAVSALLATSIAAPSYADDGVGIDSSQSFEMCRADPSGGCSRFEGYIYVRRSANNLAPTTVDERSAVGPVLAGKRLYVHVDGADSR